MYVKVGATGTLDLKTDFVEISFNSEVAILDSGEGFEEGEEFNNSETKSSWADVDSGEASLRKDFSGIFLGRIVSILSL